MGKNRFASKPNNFKSKQQSANSTNKQIVLNRNNTANVIDLHTHSGGMYPTSDKLKVTGFSKEDGVLFGRNISTGGGLVGGSHDASGAFEFNEEEIGHAYNIVAMDNGVYLVDMASSVPVTDLDGNLLDEVPFCKELNEEELQNILDKKEPISLNNVFYIYFGEKNFKFEEARQRTYRVSNVVLQDSFKKKSKSRGINNFYNA